MKKPFINRDNPALNFISSAALDVQTPPQAPERELVPETPKPASAKTKKTAEREKISAAPVGYKPNPAFIEKKSRRLQLVLQPSLYERVKAEAERSGTSVNDYIHSVLSEVTQGGK